MARVIAPDGRAGEVPDELLEDALQDGFRQETDADIQARAKEAQFGDKPIVAGALGAARSATMGLSDLLLAKSGIADREALLGIQEQNQGATSIGELGGIVGSLLLPSSPLSAVGKLGQKAGASLFAGEKLLDTVGRQAIAGAIDGGFYGAGAGLSSTVLGDPELNAEKIVAGARVGALMGAATGATIPTLGEGIKKMMPGSIGDQADNWAIKAIAGSGHKGALKKLDHKGIAGDVADFARKRGILTPLASADDMLQRAEAINREAGESIGEILKQAGHVGHVVDGADIVNKAQPLIRKYRAGNFGDQAVANRLENELGLIRQRGPMGVNQLEDLKKSFDPYLKFGAEQAPTQEALKELRSLISKHSEEALDAMALKSESGVSLGEAFRKAKQDFRMSREIADLAADRVLQLRNNASVGLREQLAVAGGLAAGEPVTGLAGAFAANVSKKYGPQIFASALGAIKDSSRGRLVSKGFGLKVREQLEKSPELFGAYRGILAQAAARGDAELLATHVAQAQTDPDYLAAMDTAGFSQSRSREMTELLRVEGLQRIGDALGEMDKKIDAAVDAVSKGKTAKRSPEPGLSRSERLALYGNSLGQLSRLVADNSLAAFMPPSELSEHAPEMGPYASAVAKRAAEFLLDKMPRHPYADLPPGARPTWQPSDYDLARLERYAKAINDPMGAIESVRIGTVTREAIEALQAVYPKMLDDLRTRLAERVSTSKERLTIDQRRAISTILGSQSAPMPIREPSPPPGQWSGAQATLPKRNIQAILTPSQRIEGR